MEIETMSSAFAGTKISASDGKFGAKTRPLPSKGAKPKASTRKDTTFPDENRPPTPTPNGAEMTAEEEFKEEDQLSIYRKFWERVWGGSFGSFDDETSLCPMSYTSGPNLRYARPEITLQIFSIRVRAPTDGLKWPLHVHGFVAIRDSIDHNRNYLFRCTRDNCQTLTPKDPFLLLTGPSRAVVLIDPITFEIQLKVKGKGESEDEMLAFGTYDVHDGQYGGLKCEYHKRCTLEYKFALLRRSVEATISVKVVDGSWPDNHRGEVVSLTSGVNGRVVLLDSRDGKMPIDSDGVIELSRHVVSVELSGKLLVAVDASQPDFLARATAIFTPEKSGTRHTTCEIGSCKLQVTVVWSLFVVY